MFVIDWQLALWSLILFPVLIIWVRVLQIFQRRAFQKLSNKQSNLNAYIHESIAGVKTTQTFAQEQAQFRTFQEQQGEVRSAWMHAVHIQFLMWPGVQTISVMTISFIYFVGVMGFGGVKRDHRRAHRVRRLREQLLESGDQHRQLLQPAHHLLGVPRAHLRDARRHAGDPQQARRGGPAADPRARRLQRRGVPLRGGRPQHPQPRRTSTSNRGAQSRWSARRAPARRRSSTCCRASTTCPRAR